jgi:hypothetical protein
MLYNEYIASTLSGIGLKEVNHIIYKYVTNCLSKDNKNCQYIRWHKHPKIEKEDCRSNIIVEGRNDALNSINYDTYCKSPGLDVLVPFTAISCLSLGFFSYSVSGEVNHLTYLLGLASLGNSIATSVLLWRFYSTYDNCLPCTEVTRIIYTLEQNIVNELTNNSQHLEQDNQYCYQAFNHNDEELYSSECTLCRNWVND